MAEVTNFPRPIPEFDAQEFWDGCNRGELLMQRCKACEKFRWLPRPMCPYCNSLEREWVKVKRQRTVDCVVTGIAGDVARPWLVLGLRHADGRVHHLGRFGVSSVILSRPRA